MFSQKDDAKICDFGNSTLMNDPNDNGSDHVEVIETLSEQGTTQTRIPLKDKHPTITRDDTRDDSPPNRVRSNEFSSPELVKYSQI